MLTLDDDDDEVLVRASAEGKVALVNRLLTETSADPAFRRNLPIREAVKNGHVNVVDRLLQDPRVDPSDYYNSPLLDAVANRHTALVERLLRDERSRPTLSVLIRAAWYGSMEIVELLLNDVRVDVGQTEGEDGGFYWRTPGVNIQLKNPIAASAVRGRVAIVKRLLDDGRADPTVSNNIALIGAAQKGYTDVVNALLDDPRVEVTPRVIESVPCVHALMANVMRKECRQQPGWDANSCRIIVQITLRTTWIASREDLCNSLRTDERRVYITKFTRSWMQKFNQQLQKAQSHYLYKPGGPRYRQAEQSFYYNAANIENRV